MAAEYMHIGIPALSEKEGVTCNENMKSCVSNVDGHDSKIGYLKFEEETPFPETLSKQPHVTYRVDDLDHYISRTQRIIFGSVDRNPDVCLTLVIWDDAIVELYEEK